jgi:hypothetical protein
MKITVLKEIDIDEKDVRIVWHGHGYCYRLYLDQEALADCAHPRPLSRYAFDRGASSVRHEYDLGLVE